MTAHLLCVLGLAIFGSDPLFPAGPPTQTVSQAQASPYDGGADPLLAQAPPPPPAPGGPAMAPAAPALDAPAAAPGDAHYFSLDELRAEMQKLAWTKGDYSIVPYGILWANLVDETSRTYPGNYPLYVSRPREDENGDCSVDARSTRLGLDLLGPRIACLDDAQTGGKVEIDFERTINVDYKSGVLLRHAYLEVENDDFRLLAGQTWDVISPLSPGVLFYSVGWDGGNIGYRRPQFPAGDIRASPTPAS